jgi:hypothetical protein
MVGHGTWASARRTRSNPSDQITSLQPENFPSIPSQKFLPPFASCILFWSIRVLAPTSGCNYLLGAWTGGLRFASTSGYSLATLQVAEEGIP